MTTLLDGLAIVSGLVFLAVGADLLVRGASGLALRLGLSPLMIGLTVVGFGTSTPELVVGIQAALRGSGDIVLGNVIGSNICNLLLVLGLASAIRPMPIHLQVLRTDVPVLIIATLLATALIGMGGVGRLAGGLLFAGIFVYVGTGIRRSRQDNREQALMAIGFRKPEMPIVVAGLPRLCGATVAGLVLLLFGSRLLVDGSVSLATRVGVSEAVIGLTLIALGTSLPEVATSVAGAIRGKTELVVGNLVGSNIFNLLFILGASSLIRPIVRDQVNWIDLGVMVAATVMIVPLMRTGWVLKRWEGLLMLAGYGAYMGWLVVGSLGMGA